MNNHVVCEGVALHVKDVERSIEFYTKLPGAKLLVHIEGKFALVQVGHGRINLVAYEDDIAFKNQKFHLEVETENLETTYRDIQAAAIEPLYPPTLQPWGETDFRIVDPDGYVIEFSEPNPVLAKIKKRMGIEV